MQNRVITLLCFGRNSLKNQQKWDSIKEKFLFMYWVYKSFGESYLLIENYTRKGVRK